MSRTLYIAVFALGLLFASPHSPAQSTRAYAPENLGQLSTLDRVRVIEREYSDQSRGRQIPDDQLEFYLDQVNSGWGFSKIKQDIATSLRGNQQGNWRPNPGWNSQTVTCSSNDKRRHECRVPFNGRPVLVENISSTNCIEGQNFGGGGGVIWVDRGCRGRFSEGRGSSIGNSGTIRCESQNNRQQVCNTGWRNATLVRQLSGTRCVEGQNWGQRSGSVWVSGGCRAEFAEARGGGHNSNYSVTCSSNNKSRRTCAWDSRQGRPVVIEQLSGTRCNENQNWGYNGNAIWVSGGCRARFGVR